jgi:hypothetical protein
MAWYFALRRSNTSSAGRPGPLSIPAWICCRNCSSWIWRNLAVASLKPSATLATLKGVAFQACRLVPSLPRQAGASKSFSASFCGKSFWGGLIGPQKTRWGKGCRGSFPPAPLPLGESGGLGAAPPSALGRMAVNRFWCGQGAELSTDAACQLQEILKLQNLDYRFI